MASLLPTGDCMHADAFCWSFLEGTAGLGLLGLTAAMLVVRLDPFMQLVYVLCQYARLHWRYRYSLQGVAGYIYS